jgi:hypothetical protein
VREIGSRLELFVDDWLIERMDGVSLQMHHPVPQEVALLTDQPWEGNVTGLPVVIKDGERYRMWYRGCYTKGTEPAPDRIVYPDEGFAYAESDDGVHWERPSLGICEFNGSKDNNIVLFGGVDSGTARELCVFKDGNPAAPDSERYKAIGRGFKMDGGASARGLVSPDGLNWNVIEKDPIIIAPRDGWRLFDSHFSAFWDVVQEQYVVYMRGLVEESAPDSGQSEQARRHIRRSTSPDFREWTEPEFVQPYPGILDIEDRPAENLYHSSCTPYYRAPHIYVMFPPRYVGPRQISDQWEPKGLTDSVFMSSRDGKNWDRRFMEAFLRPGSDPLNWIGHLGMHVGVGVVPTSPTEMSLYYVEHPHHPSNRIRRGTLRIDGFVSVSAPFSGGELVTRPLSFEGGELVLNYASSIVSSLRVEIQDAGGHPIDGYGLSDSVAIYGDEIERVVAWQGGADVGALSGKPVRLRITMKDADLYSIRFRPSS